MAYFFGQTQTRGSSAADLEAMNAPASKLPSLCAAGNLLACKLANIPVETSEQQAIRAENRELQAQADRLATGNHLIDAGINTAIAYSAANNKNVVYAKTQAEAEAIIQQEKRGQLNKLILALIAAGILVGVSVWAFR